MNEIFRKSDDSFLWNFTETNRTRMISLKENEKEIQTSVSLNENIRQHWPWGHSASGDSIQDLILAPAAK